MMKKKIVAVLICMLMLTVVCTLFACAEEAGTGETAVWDFWALLDPKNVDYFHILAILVTTIGTFIRMAAGGGLKQYWDLFVKTLKGYLTGA